MGNYALKLNGEWHFTESKTNFINTIKCDSIFTYIAESGYYKATRNGKAGIINSIGEEIIPFQYDDIYPNITENQSIVRQGEKWALGTFPFDYLDFKYDGVRFEDHRIAVKKEKKIEYFDLEGKLIQ